MDGSILYFGGAQNRRTGLLGLKFEHAALGALLPGLGLLI